MKQVRLGVIGLGYMGGGHIKHLQQHKISRVELTAVCDHHEERLARFAPLKTFRRGEDLIHSGEVDAVLIATPHFLHTDMAIAALQHGLHVLVEKPISAHKADCERLLAAHTNKKLVFSSMFNQRTDPHFLKIRELVQNGELGERRRINWTLTTWFRTQAYYAESNWRATWAGEGGGVLINQGNHQLDLWCWMFGRPQRVRGFCNLGRYHDIEVEDDVTAWFEYANGATGVLITSTGETPGTNRLEIVGDRGKLLMEHDQLAFTQNEGSMSEFSRTNPVANARPAATTHQLPIHGRGGQHAAVLQNFIDAILDGVPLIAPAEEGIHSVELANAILFSSFLEKTVELPLDGVAYERHLNQLIANSKRKP